MEKITLDIAIEVIQNYLDEDDFITKNISQYMNGEGDVDDNSIELSDYFMECKSIVAEHISIKHG